MLIIIKVNTEIKQLYKLVRLLQYYIIKVNNYHFKLKIYISN